MGEPDKATIAEIDRRVTEVYKLLCRGANRAQVVRHCSDKWGIGSRQAENYMARARKQMRELLAESREDLLSIEIAFRNDLLLEASQKGKLFTALQIADSRARLLGLFEPSSEQQSKTSGIELRLVMPESQGNAESV